MILFLIDFYFDNVLILNKEEAYSLYKRYNAKGGLLEGLHLLGPKIVVVTNKDKETWCYDGKKHHKIIPHKNIHVVERTGAGDAFASEPNCLEVSGYHLRRTLRSVIPGLTRNPVFLSGFSLSRE